LKRGEAVFNEIFSKYKAGAKRRRLIFNLTKEEFAELVKQNCYYCGKSPQTERYKRGANGNFIYNGIDRVDNNRGYELDNCVACCKYCNIAKHTLTQADFFKLIKKIADRHVILEQEKNAVL